MELRAGVAYSIKNAQSGRYPDVPQGTNEDTVFVLTRLNGTDVVRWTTREPDTQVFDAWPKDVLTKKS